MWPELLLQILAKAAQRELALNGYSPEHKIS